MSITVTAVPQQSTGSPRTQLTATSSVGTLTAPITVTRIHPDGSQWPVLVESGAAMIGGSWTGVDYHAPFNQSVTYQAAAGGTTSAVSTSVMVVSRSTVWLLPPSSMDLAVAVDVVVEIGEPSFADTSIDYQVLNNALPNVRNNRPRGGEVGTMKVLCRSSESWAELFALFAVGGPVLINNPRDTWLAGWKWVQPGPLQQLNPATRDNAPMREGAFAYRQVNQPDADSVSWTYDEMAAAYSTYDALAAAFSTYDRLKLRIPG